MTATRTIPDIIAEPSGEGGDTYFTKLRAEIEGAWNGIVNQVGSIAGTADAIAGVCSPVLIGAYVNGQTFRLTPSADNTTAVTVNLDGKGAKALVQPDGTALVSGDLVSGEPVTFWYDSVLGKFRLTQYSTQQIGANALAAVTASLQVDKIGDTTVGGAVAQIEHTFVAGTYSKILVLLSGMSGSAVANQLLATLRNASAAIVTLQTVGGAPWTSAGTTQLQAGDIVTAQAEFLIDLVTSGATKTHFGSFKGGGWNANAGAVGVINPITDVAGASATAPDRVRYAYQAGNIDAGRMITFGFKA